MNWKLITAGAILGGTSMFLLVCACNMASPSLTGSGGPMGGDFGATQGGVQDMSLARELCANGRVPPADAFVVEGMFSEHDLGLTGDACEQLLCLRTAMGISPTLDGEASGWLEVGMSSTINLETFERPSLTVIAAVDNSGSMGWGYTTESNEYNGPLAIAQGLLSQIVDELGPQDQFALVTYGSDVATNLDFVSGDRKTEIQNAISAMRAEGSTNMEAGLRRAYELAAEADSDAEQTRVLLFTDVQPNVGATTASEFDRMVSNGAANDVGITIFGVGVGLGQTVFKAMAHVRGGNAFALFDSDDVAELMENDWPWLVSPIAYDLTLDLIPAEGYEVASTYGFPTGEGDAGPGLDVSTVFLSKRKGALLVRLIPETPAEDLTGLNVTGTLSYQTPQGQAIQDTLEASYDGQALDEQGRYFDQAAVAKTVALALLVTAMHDTADVYGDDPDSAITIMENALSQMVPAAESLGDEAFDVEIQLANDLLELMETGAEQGNLYPTELEYPLY